MAFYMGTVRGDFNLCGLLEIREVEMETWFLLYGGNSSDGRGQGVYCGRTIDKHRAKKHYDSCKDNPYSTGKVVIVSDRNEEMAGWQTEWEKL